MERMVDSIRQFNINKTSLALEVGVSRTILYEPKNRKHVAKLQSALRRRGRRLRQILDTNRPLYKKLEIIREEVGVSYTSIANDVGVSPQAIDEAVARKAFSRARERMIESYLAFLSEKLRNACLQDC